MLALTFESIQPYGLKLPELNVIQSTDGISIFNSLQEFEQETTPRVSTSLILVCSQSSDATKQHTFSNVPELIQSYSITNNGLCCPLKHPTEVQKIETEEEQLDTGTQGPSLPKIPVNPKLP